LKDKLEECVEDNKEHFFLGHIGSIARKNETSQKYLLNTQNGEELRNPSKRQLRKLNTAQNLNVIKNDQCL